ncbi:MAG: LysR family transcriptional regulator [Proteobacteria bacterium]|nr:LysR family transcriptional regulator [Pseudomonadota bacterium]
MNLQQLKYIRSLAEEGSFVAAAARCSVTQPTLSNGIALLEAELGYRLFHRTTRSVRLTPAGERLLPAIINTLNAYARLKELCKQTGDADTTVSVGFSPVIGIQSAEKTLKIFCSQHPHVKIIYCEGNFSELYERLKQEQIDIIITPFDEKSAPAGSYMRQYLTSEPLVFLSQVKDVFFGEHAHQVSLREISSQSFVLPPSGCGLTQVTKRLFNNHNLPLNRYPGEPSSYAVVQEWTELGLGSGILPQSKINGPSRERAIPIVDEANNEVRIQYFALGKPNTISSELFDELWSAIGLADRRATQTDRAGAPKLPPDNLELSSRKQMMMDINYKSAVDR